MSSLACKVNRLARKVNTRPERFVSRKVHVRHTMRAALDGMSAKNNDTEGDSHDNRFAHAALAPRLCSTRRYGETLSQSRKAQA